MRLLRGGVVVDDMISEQCAIVVEVVKGSSIGEEE